MNELFGLRLLNVTQIGGRVRLFFVLGGEAHDGQDIVSLVWRKFPKLQSNKYRTALPWQPGGMGYHQASRVAMATR